MPLRQTDARPLVFTGPRMPLKWKRRESLPRADPGESVRSLSVSQKPLRRACDLVQFVATVALHCEWFMGIRDFTKELGTLGKFDFEA